MKINVKNFDAIEKALQEANGKATARLADLQDVQDYVIIIEKSLTEKGIPKNLWQGLKFQIMPQSENLPNAYFKRGTPQATQFTLERGSTGWFMTSACRNEFYHSRKILMITNFTKEQERAIIREAYKF